MPYCSECEECVHRDNEIISTHWRRDKMAAIFLNENIRISITISLKLVTKVPINNIPALVQIMVMAWCRPGDQPLSEPMMVCLLTHICVTRPQRNKYRCNCILTMLLGLAVNNETYSVTFWLALAVFGYFVQHFANRIIVTHRVFHNRSCRCAILFRVYSSIGEVQ